MKTRLTLLISFINLFVFNCVYSQSDTPCNAPFLTVNTDSCVFVTGSTLGATYQNDPVNGGTPNCAYPGSPDVWYKFIVPPSGSVAITTYAGSITDGGMAVYNGTCSNPQFIECDDDDAINLMPVIDRSDFIPGDTILIRFWRAGGNTTGTFNICVIESHSDCISAIPLCGSKFKFNVNAYGPGSNLDAYSVNCDITEYQSQWLKFRFLTSGYFTFTIYPDSIAPGIYPDFDWIYFQSNSSNFCSTYNSTLASLCCNGSSSMGIVGETGLGVAGTSCAVPSGAGNPYSPQLNATAGDTYYLFINNFATTSSGFEIQFGGNAMLDCSILTDLPETKSQTINSESVYPNPFTNEIIIAENKAKREFQLYNMIGTLVKQVALTEIGESKIYAGELTKGIYIYKIFSKDESVFVGKLIKK